MKSTVGAKIGAGFATALLFLIVIGLVTYRSTTHATETADWVAHSHEVLRKVDTLLQMLVDAETGQRGYIISSQEPYLEPYESATSAVMQAMKDLRALTKDNLDQQRRLDALEPSITARLNALKEGIDAEKAKPGEGGQIGRAHV